MEMTGHPGNTLRELTELKKTWRQQDFIFTAAQQERYELLLQMRRSHVNYWRENGMMWVGPSNAGKTLEEVSN
jgi:hypothetical protein